MDEKYKKAIELGMRISYNKGLKDAKSETIVPIDTFIKVKIIEISCLIRETK